MTGVVVLALMYLFPLATTAEWVHRVFAKGWGRHLPGDVLLELVFAFGAATAAFLPGAACFAFALREIGREPPSDSGAPGRLEAAGWVFFTLGVVVGGPANLLLTFVLVVRPTA